MPLTMFSLSWFLAALEIVWLVPSHAASTAGNLVTQGANSNFKKRDDSGSHGEATSSDWHYPVGDPRRCLQASAKDKFRVERFEVLPGNGWDNLRNVEQGQIVTFTFFQCRTTDDGRFLLPDTVTAVPLKNSRLEVFAELIANWKDWTSLTSRTVNLDAGLDISDVSISGKFSAAFGDMKSKLVTDKSLATRSQARYVRYSVHLQPDTPLHPTFRGRLLKIAAAHEVKDGDYARYLAQVLVRDFGTHVITSADAGTALVQVDHLKEEWIKENSAHTSDILSSASASLYSVFNLKTSYDSKTASTFLSNYINHRTSSVVETFGGPLYTPANFTKDQWAQEADRDLVALDRSGDPLHYFVTPATLPELSASTLAEVQRSVLEAVETYYAYNVIPGCLHPDSPNFSPSANVDDGSCQSSASNLTFGGMYQTCVMAPGSNNGDLCNGMTQQNPLTGDFSCPAGYQPVLLNEGSLENGRTQQTCSRYMLFWKRCSDTLLTSAATVRAYWCVADSPVPDHRGYLFGGLFTSFVPNPVTRAPTCPPGFFMLRVGSARDLHVCISDDLEFGAKGAVPFAGFVSCRAGNPLAVAEVGAASARRGQSQPDATGPGSSQGSAAALRRFYKSKTGDWPQRCPEGFSKHLAAVDQGCQISYCVRTGAIAGPLLPAIQRPPFVHTPLSSPPEVNALLEKATHIMRKEDEVASHGLTPGAAAGVTAGATLGVVLLVLVVGTAARIRRRRRQQEYRKLSDSLLTDKASSDYGSASSAAYSEI